MKKFYQAVTLGLVLAMSNSALASADVGYTNVSEPTFSVSTEEAKTGFEFSNDVNHSYSETIEGTILLNRYAFLKSEMSDKYSVRCNPVERFAILPSDMMILRFTAKGEKFSGHISVNINDGQSLGKFTLQTEKTEYYIPVTGLSEINSIELKADSEEQLIYIGDVELVNYYNTPVTNLKSGLYNIEAVNKTTVKESEAIGEAATSLISDSEYLYAIRNGVLKIYTQKDNSIVGTLSGLGNTRDMDFYSEGKYLVITSRENGAYFVNIEDKSNPFIVSHYSTLEMATGLCVYGNYVFLCSRYYGLEIVDISDIYNPKFVTQITKPNEEYYDCCVSDGYLYISAWGQKKVLIYSLEDICNPVNVQTVSVDGNCGGISVIDGILYVATGYNNLSSNNSVTNPGYGMGNGFEIYDVSNPTEPIWLSSSKIDGRYKNPAFDHWKIKIDGKYAYYTNIYNGVYIYDISDLKAPKRVENIVIYIDKESSKYKKIVQGTYVLPYDTTDHGQGEVSAITVSNGKMYFSDTTTGLYMIEDSRFGTELIENGELSGTEKNTMPIEAEGYNVSLYQVGGSVYATEETENYIYLACGDKGILVLDKNFNLVNTVATQGPVKDLLIVGDLIYTAESEKGIGVYHISNGTLEYVSSCTLTDYNTYFSQLELSGDKTAILAQSEWTKASVVDISDKRNPKIVTTIKTSSMYCDNLASGTPITNALSFYDAAGMYCYEKDASGEYVSTFTYKGSLVSERNGIANYNGGILMICSNGYITFDPKTTDASTLNTIPVVKIENTPLRGKPAIYSNTMVISDAYTNQVTIVDISDVENPVLVSQFAVSSTPDVATITNDYILIPLRNGGLLKLSK
jgi:hypothetical protein